MTENPASQPAPAATHRLVVGIDGSEGGTRALDWAAGQAALTGSVLDIHTVHGSQYQYMTHGDVAASMADLTDLAVTRARKVAPGVATTTTGHEGQVVRALAEASKDADLLVVGSRGLGGFAGLVLGSVGRGCALHAHCPVVVVRPPESPVDDANWWPPRRILVGVDGSGASTLALEWAMHEAELANASVVAVTAWTWPKYFGWGMPLPGDYDASKDADAVLRGAVESASDRHPSVAISQKVVEGHPALTLVDESGYFDLLVVGSRGHGELAGTLLGSVSEHCVSHAHCPVVVMRGNRRSTPGTNPDRRHAPSATSQLAAR